MSPMIISENVKRLLLNLHLSILAEFNRRSQKVFKFSYCSTVTAIMFEYTNGMI